MAEPIALNVIGALPLRISGQSRGTLSRIAKTSKRPSLATSFFTPIPRQDTGKMKAVESPPLGMILDCQAWACPRSKNALWRENGLMRSLLLAELSPEASQLPSGRRIRRTSQSSRTRFRQPTHPPTPQLGPRMQRHLNYSTGVSGSAPSRHAPFIPASRKVASEDSKPEASSSIEKLRSCLQHQSRSQENLAELTEAFTTAKDEGTFLSLPPDEILGLGQTLADHIDGLCVDQVLPDIIEAWGTQLHELLEHLPSGSYTTTAQGDPLERSLYSRASSFQGRFDNAESFLQNAPTSWKDWDKRHEVYRTAFVSFQLSMAIHHGLYQSLEYLWLKNRRFRNRFGADEKVQKFLVNTLNLLDVIEPTSKWDPSQARNMFDTLIRACLEQKAFPIAAEMIDEVTSRGIRVSSRAIFLACKGLASMKRHIETANRLFKTIPPSETEEYTRIKLYLAGRKGDSQVARELVEKRRKENIIKNGDLSSALAALAKRGRIKDVQDMFDEYFPMGPDGKRTGDPNVFHYTNAIQAHVQLGDSRGIGMWLEDMEKSEVTPNPEFFTTVISLFRQLGDIKGSFSTFEFMRRAGVKPDSVTYTVLISLLATIQDCDTADALYIQAIEEDGIIPDDVMTNALMNAHIEAGSWKEVIRIFHHLTTLPANRQPPIDTYNSLLKAYVLIGAPFRLMSKLFFKLQGIGGKPDTYTFAVLIQSAVDSNQLDIACEIYSEAKRREEETGQRTIISQHILTILMSAYLRQRKMDRAKELFDEMVEQGLQPTSVTFGAIIKAYGKRVWEERMSLAEDFVKKLQVEREWERHPITKGQHLVNFYGPLLSNYAKKGNVEQVERVYTEFLEAGGRPFVGFFQYLLNSYCIVGDAEKAMNLWPIIRDLAEGETINEDVPGKEMRTRMANIHVPLSVYIDVLSKAGQHDEVAGTWSELQKEEFEFDSHNWNHLCVALVRAGRIERAFEILERILLPYESATRSINDNVRNDKELSLQDKLQISDGVEPPPLQPPMHNQQARQSTATAGKTSLAKDGKIDLLDDDEAIDADFSYPFSILQIISPNWNFWRPHNVVLRTLLIALLQMQRGYVIRPIAPGERTTDNVSSTEDEERNPDAAEAMLEDLYAKYPRTTVRLRWFQSREARRLGVIAFEKLYMRR